MWISVCVVVFCVCYFLFAENAAALFVKYFIEREDFAEQITIEEMSGTIFSGVVLKNLDIKNIQNIPFPNSLRIQNLRIKIHFFRNPVGFKLENARLVLANEEPVVFSGTYQKNQLDFDVYSRGIDTGLIFQWIATEKIFLKRSRGYLKNIQLRVQGTISQPNLEGNFTVEKFLDKNFSVVKLPVHLDLNIKELGKNFKLQGKVFCGEGILLFRNSEIKILESSIVYVKDANNPALFIDGLSIIDSTKIKLSLRGFLKDPKIELTSYPPLSQERLLVMLATNKSWRSLERSLGDIKKNEVSSDMVKDFFDYAFLGGSGERMAQKLGIKDGWVRMNQNQRAIGIKKSLSNELDVGYEVEETKNIDSTKDVKYKMLGDMKITDAITVSVEKELKNNQQQDQSQNQKNIPEDKVFIKYQRRF